MIDFKIGQIVRSKAGRDRDKLFIILAIDHEYVYLVDGHYRKVDQPKKKKLKHIQPTHHIVEEFQNDSKLTNSDIRKMLEFFILETNNVGKS